MQSLPSTSGRSAVTQPAQHLCRLRRLPLVGRKLDIIRSAPHVSRTEAVATEQSRTQSINAKDLAAFVAFSSLAGPVENAFASEASVAYNAAGGDEFLKNLAGVAYILLVGVFLFRLLRRRAAKAKSERVASQSTAGPSVFSQLREKVGAKKPGKATPLTAFLGCCQASLLAWGLWIFSTKVQGVIEAQSLPDSYTARNIAITVRTIITGLCYLATFIFAANGVGLAGLSVQLLLFPNSLQDDEAEEDDEAAAAAARGPQLPQVRITSHPQQLRAAFGVAERLGKQEAGKAAGAPGGGSGSGSGSSGEGAGGSVPPKPDA
ncbi:hypothetical protein Agub_g1951 [Astrephomene gubernaculifera]|uniref:Uncharacterized protein n=1 Tax=Astrephomene gubernaculifera TaxID=47775 RepID=A0AAD3DGB2_9CHLO|nr:hypothetical protein Agub_g1951 [Astrephomene gubernaculifera]